MATMFPVLTVTGPRQSGKTTLVKAAFPKHAYVNLENLDDRAAADEDPRTFLTRFDKQPGVIIDEAQKIPHLFSYLQQIVDESQQMGRFILTGSQNFLLLESITQSLAGRVSVNHLFPFSLSELTLDLTANKSLDEVLFSGLFPAIYDRKIPAEHYYPSYLQTYIERDVRSLKNIGDLNLFRRFLQLCAGRVGQLINFSSLGNEAGIDSKTAQSWLSILEASFIIFRLSPYHKNFNKRIVKQSKLYFCDTGLMCSLLGLDKTEFVADFYLRGNLFENFVVAEYRKICTHLGKAKQINFWRDNTGNEVDLLIEVGTELHAVEIKSGATVNESFFTGLKKFRNISGLGRENCWVVYGGDTCLQRNNANLISWRDIEALPR